MIYLDTSAAMKLLREETGTQQVRRLFESEEFCVASRLLAVELHVAAARQDLDPCDVDQVLNRVQQISIDDDVIAAAIGTGGELRSLDAIHLGTIVALGEIVTGVLTFDTRLRAAVAARRLPLVALPA